MIGAKLFSVILTVVLDSLTFIAEKTQYTCTYTAYKNKIYLLLVQINELFLDYILYGYPGVVES
jgi:hypothetical protein